MSEKIYAIKMGFDTKTNKIISNTIVNDWDTASKLVQGITQKKHGITPDFKKCKTLEEAELFFAETDPLLRKTDNTYPIDALHCYVDGCFNTELGNYGFGAIYVKDDKIVDSDYGTGNNTNAIKIQNVAGELLGAIKALLFAKNNGFTNVVVFHDYIGVCYHALGVKWKIEDSHSLTYNQWMQNFFKNNPDINIHFCKVDAHTGDMYNELADGLSKISVGITPEPKYLKALNELGLIRQ